ncbi:hypothetical protein D9758_012565 [Tetrapyrgos nigripes]|uniref:Enoyl reductase (ER) domain-containing protein n=1 Tax=Tetrapyrgos nigripes TaxID=182062 RepID=A0A8H5CJ40_9AGAR|nr:hypothetical protein D9758_012565 [Tetrapyrgos nigripes]
MSQIPSSMIAVVSTGELGKVHLKNTPVPKPGSGQILVKVIAAAQNPSEWMKLTRTATPDVPAGHDFAGIVVGIGPDVPVGLRNVGERVAGFVNGCFSLELGGTFAEYTLADAQVLVTIPEKLSFEDAATIGLAGFTACQTLWQSQSLPNPLEPSTTNVPIFVHGGASSVGQIVIQLAKLSGLHVVSTASSRNHQLLRDLGADDVFDYRDPEVSKKVREATNGGLEHVVDCIASAETARLIRECVRENTAHVSSVLDTDVAGGNIKADFPFVYTLLGKAIVAGPVLPPSLAFPPIPEHYELGKKFGSLLSRLLAEEKLKTTPVKLVPNGLADAQYWIEYQQQGKISAEKIVYRIADTPALS